MDKNVDKVCKIENKGRAWAVGWEQKVAVLEHNCSQSTAQYSFCPWAIRSRTASLCDRNHCQHINMLILQPFFNKSVWGCMGVCVGGQVSGIMICVSVCGFMCAPCVRLESKDRFCRKMSRSCIKIQAFTGWRLHLIDGEILLFKNCRGGNILRQILKLSTKPAEEVASRCTVHVCLLHFEEVGGRQLIAARWWQISSQSLKKQAAFSDS